MSVGSVGRRYVGPRRAADRREDGVSEVSASGSRTEVAGVPIDWVDLNAAIERIVALAHEARPAQVCTVNLDFLVSAQRDSEVRSILRHSALNLADGAPVVGLRRLQGESTPGRVAGADLVPRLAQAAADNGLSMFFLGGEGGVAAEAARRLVLRHPKLRVSVYEPPRAKLEDMDDAAMLARVWNSGAQILLVAFGHPKQEKWISRHVSDLPLVVMGVGCSLDLIAGRASRAPLWMQRSGLEWSYRLIQEPKRLVRRYLVDGLLLVTVLAPRTLVERLRGRLSSDALILSPQPVIVIPPLTDGEGPVALDALQSEGDQADKGSCIVTSDPVAVATEGVEELAG